MNRSVHVKRAQFQSKSTNLGGGGIELLLPLSVGVGADLPGDLLGRLLALGACLRVAELAVHHVLHVQLDGPGLVGEAGHADLGVDGGVGVPAVGGRRAVAVVGLGGGHGRGGDKGQDDKGLGRDSKILLRFTLA